MRIVDQKMADDCIREFEKQSISSKKQITTGVGFDAKKLAAWLQKVSPHASEIHVRFGIYTPDHAPKKDVTGRTTVFFCACDDDGNPAQDESGEDIPPVNQGEPYP